MNEEKTTTVRNEKKPRHRSPNYPYVGLRESVDRVEKFYKADGKAGAPADLAAVHIGFSKPHGQAMSVLAALKKFGLVIESGGRIVPTQRAIEIINLKSDDPRRTLALKEALVDPAIYKELIEQHRETGWPQDDVLESELVTYRNFNPNAVASFVKDLRDSLEFAGLSGSTTLESEIENTPETDMSTPTPIPLDKSVKTPPPGGKPPDQVTPQISTPVGIEDGRPVFAHVRFDGAIKKEFVASLKKYLDYLEGTLQ